MNGLSGKHSEEVLKKMCEFVGVKDTDVDWEDREWFLQYSWTAETEQKFIEWLANFLIKHKYVKLGKKRALHEASKMAGDYGWRTKG